MYSTAVELRLGELAHRWPRRVRGPKLKLPSPERGDLQLGVVLGDLDLVTGETGAQVVQGQEGVVEVQRGDLIGHLGVVGAAGVPVAQDDVVQPVRHHALRVHQVPDGLQHRLAPTQKVNKHDVSAGRGTDRTSVPILMAR